MGVCDIKGQFLGKVEEYTARCMFLYSDSSGRKYMTQTVDVWNPLISNVSLL
jgi:hypothetical protein